jgi:hypothetical protein
MGLAGEVPEASAGEAGGGGEGGLVIEGGLLTLGSSAAKAGREHRHNNPIATRRALHRIEVSEFLMVAASNETEQNFLGISFIC